MKVHINLYIDTYLIYKCLRLLAIVHLIRNVSI